MFWVREDGYEVSSENIEVKKKNYFRENFLKFVNNLPEVIEKKKLLRKYTIRGGVVNSKHISTYRTYL